MLPILHPVAKTSIELRRAINRLHLYRDQNPQDELIEVLDQLISDLKSARSHIPSEFVDPDLQEV